MGLGQTGVVLAWGGAELPESSVLVRHRGVWLRCRSDKADASGPRLRVPQLPGGPGTPRLLVVTGAALLLQGFSGAPVTKAHPQAPKLRVRPSGREAREAQARQAPRGSVLAHTTLGVQHWALRSYRFRLEIHVWASSNVLVPLSGVMSVIRGTACGTSCVWVRRAQ